MVAESSTIRTPSECSAELQFGRKLGGFILGSYPTASQRCASEMQIIYRIALKLQATLHQLNTKARKNTSGRVRKVYRVAFISDCPRSAARTGMPLENKAGDVCIDDQSCRCDRRRGQCGAAHRYGVRTPPIPPPFPGRCGSTGGSARTCQSGSDWPFTRGGGRRVHCKRGCACERVRPNTDAKWKAIRLSDGAKQPASRGTVIRKYPYSAPQPRTYVESGDSNADNRGFLHRGHGGQCSWR